MNRAILEIESLSLSVGDKPILHGVSMSVRQGERWSIIGPNGAGKSSLLKCLMRIHTGWGGRISLFGRLLSQFSQRELARRIAYVPQPGEDGRFPYTVRQFVSMSRYPYAGPFGTRRSGDADAVEAAMERTDVSRYADRALDTLSGGERQKVYIAAALAQGGEILLLDEPTAFLDYRHQAEVVGLLHAINRDSGATILTVTHDINTALLAGGHGLALRAGQVVFAGSVSGLACERRLGEIFGASFRFLNDAATGLCLVAPQGMPA
jgi:iron complex transport system ATP-binding protein